MSERGLVMCVHSIALGLIAYGIMCYLLKQSPVVAENRSVLLGSVALWYMVSFGHDIPPKSFNPQLF